MRISDWSSDVCSSDLPRLVELVLSESTAVLRAVPNVLITRHRLGLVMANAGIDRSNIGPGGEDRALLLPRDPDASARRISLRSEEHTSELQSLMRLSYAVFCMKKKTIKQKTNMINTST